jgi:hypothetical protein
MDLASEPLRQRGNIRTRRSIDGNAINREQLKWQQGSRLVVAKRQRVASAAGRVEEAPDLAFSPYVHGGIDLAIDGKYPLTARLVWRALLRIALDTRTPALAGGLARSRIRVAEEGIFLRHN